VYNVNITCTYTHTQLSTQFQGNPAFCNNTYYQQKINNTKQTYNMYHLQITVQTKNRKHLQNES